jgi:hypothetical protein
MLSYWNLVADGLFKIRYCENIDVIVTPLPPFSRPIDPGALVRAAAAGINPSQIASALNAPLPIVGIAGASTEKSEICDSSFSSVETLQTLHLLNSVYIGD